MSIFDDPQAVARYAETPSRLVPGFASMQRMALILLKEKAPDIADILVLGAGGGLELTLFAKEQPGWRLVGVDPSAEMLGLATRMMGPLADRAELHEGTIVTAPHGPFDAATCLLVLHFLDRAERAETLREMRARLKPGAPFVVAHHSIPDGPGERDLWLGRYAEFAARSGVQTIDAQKARIAIGEKLPVLTPEEDAEMLAAAGFSHVGLFYAGFTFRGWVSYA